MSKCIAYCADGTWDKSTNSTNVYKIFKSLTVNADQTVFYDDGVGADGNPISKLLGGAFGAGLFQKIKEGYAQIAQVYEAGDPLFLFGFSRGAYTARSLAGMIAICGLPTKSFTNDLVEAAFSAYRATGAARDALLAQLNGCDMYDAKIAMVGVWDTVGSLGIPATVGLVDPILYSFLDTSLHPDVHNAYHALAIDERREEFPATLWTSQPAPGQTLEQVWFTGVHSDVGGGEPVDNPGVTALSDITLSWMMNKAGALGLSVAPAAQALHPFPTDPKSALDTLHSSWNVLWGIPKRRPVATASTIANSVAVRLLNDSSYRPENLDAPDGVLAPHYAIETSVTELTRGAGC
ncbi:MAG: DUF2235 domain-containing protein [Bryobacteraceae bacterium]|jgi:uncharacterized protein (DUF2235 family)